MSPQSRKGRTYRDMPDGWLRDALVTLYANGQRGKSDEELRRFVRSYLDTLSPDVWDVIRRHAAGDDLNKFGRWFDRSFPRRSAVTQADLRDRPKRTPPLP
jgi:hypothetical protein